MIPISIIVFALSFILVIITSNQTQNIACSHISSIIQEYEGPLKRELLFGDILTSKRIFADVKAKIADDFSVSRAELTPSKGKNYSCSKEVLTLNIEKPLSFAGKDLGSIYIKIIFWPVIFSLVVAIIFLLVLTFTLKRQLSKISANLDKEIVRPISNLSLGIWKGRHHQIADEVLSIKNNIDQLKEKLASEQKRNSDLEKSEEIAKLASQVAHDIRSPVTLLKALSQENSGMDEKNKKLLKIVSSRINKIAEDLLIKNKACVGLARQEDIFVLPIIEKIIFEKKSLHRQKKLEINLQIDNSAAKVRLNINQTALERTLSNLIENSIEACLGNQPKVAIKLYTLDKERISLSVSDNGIGIPADLLTQLGQKGISYGKENGNGLGLYQVRQFIESNGGEFIIQSTQGVGTTISLIFTKTRQKEQSPIRFKSLVPPVRIERT